MSETNNMSKFNYYKRVVEGVTTELHLHENREDYIVSKKFPDKTITDEVYNQEEFIECEDVNEWLDVGLKVGIFNTTPIPAQSA